MDARVRPRDDSHMSLDLADAELATAAQACRPMACQEGERAKREEKPDRTRAYRRCRTAVHLARGKVRASKDEAVDFDGQVLRWAAYPATVNRILGMR